MQPPPRAFTAKGNGIARELQSEVIVELPSFLGSGLNKHQKFLAIWDTGATNSVITANAAKILGLIPTGKIPTHGVHGTQVVNKYLVNLILPNNVRFPNLSVSEAPTLGGTYDVLIGMDIIAKGDFAVTQANNQTCFSFRVPPGSTHIDFVDEINSAQAKLLLKTTSSGGGSLRKTSRRKK